MFLLQITFFLLVALSIYRSCFKQNCWVAITQFGFQNDLVVIIGYTFGPDLDLHNSLHSLKNLNG
jgi:hypothetical protein